MTPKAVRVLRDRKAGAPEAANGRVKAIRAVFSWALEEEHVALNPAREIRRIKSAQFRLPQLDNGGSREI